MRHSDEATYDAARKLLQHIGEGLSEYGPSGPFARARLESRSNDMSSENHPCRKSIMPATTPVLVTRAHPAG